MSAANKHRRLTGIGGNVHLDGCNCNECQPKKRCSGNCNGCKSGAQLKLRLPDPNGQKELKLKDVWDPI